MRFLTNAVPLKKEHEKHWQIKCPRTKERTKVHRIRLEKNMWLPCDR